MKIQAKLVYRTLGVAILVAGGACAVSFPEAGYQPATTTTTTTTTTTGSGGGPACAAGVMPCTTQADCPMPTVDCVAAACTQGCCTTTDLPANTQCSTGFCNG